MHHRPFNHTGVFISEIGLGCWQLGGADWGAVSDEQASQILQAAIDGGTNFFDTADVYGSGRSETLIGHFLRDTRAKVFVATKLGRFPQPGGAENLSKQIFREHTEASLRRLGVEALDLTQLHCIPTRALRTGECFDWLRTLKSEGKIKAFGASVESMEEAQICLKQEGLASLQIIFNIFRQKPIEAIFDEAHAKGVAIIVRLPIASGLLSGKMTRETQFSKTDHRNYNRDGQAFNVGETFAGLPYENGVELADKLKTMLPAGMSMPQLALRWCLDFSAVTTVIPGASRPQQARDNASASNLSPLSLELHARLSDFYTDRVTPHIRGPI